ncbi:MFS transporter [Candidatus Bathyarchaeota archaeon]|nr:MFS transporter [Candidatus Bathyarchaeota archaeon]
MVRKNIYLICAALFPLTICSGIIYSILSLFIADLGASKTQIGIVFTIGSIGGAVAAPLFGRTSDKIGSKVILLVSMALFFIVFLSYSLARNLIGMCIIQAIEGIAWAALGVSGMYLVTDSVPTEQKGEAIGLYNMTWYLGWIIGPGLGGFLSDSIGFRRTFILCSILILIGVLLTIKALNLIKGEVNESN